MTFFSKTPQSDIFQGPIFALNAGAWQEAETDEGDRKGQVVDGGKWKKGQSGRGKQHSISHPFPKLI